MHIPVLLAGFLVGPASGALTGLLAPGLSFLLSSMPPAYAVPLMSLELLFYGVTAGILYQRLKWNIYIVLILTLIAGRIGFAIGLVLLGLVIELPYGLETYFGAAVVAGLPGIIIQIIIIPPIIWAVQRKLDNQ